MTVLDLSNGRLGRGLGVADFRGCLLALEVIFFMTNYYVMMSDCYRGNLWVGGRCGTNEVANTYKNCKYGTG